MNENDITDLVLSCVKELSPKGQRRFVGSVLNVGLLPDSLPALEVRHRTRWLDARRRGATPKDREPEAVLVAIAPDPELKGEVGSGAPASEVDGVLLWRDQLVVLLESKVGDYELTRDQMARHAAAWGIPRDVGAWREANSPPPGFGFVTWSALLHRVGELAQASVLDAADRASLAALSEELQAHRDLLRLYARRVAARATPLRIAALPAAVTFDTVLARLRPGDVWEKYAPLYKTDRSPAVTEAGCVEDAKRVIERYKRARLAVPPGLYEVGKKSGLVHDVMTPDRMLTSAVQDVNRGMFSDGAPNLMRRLLGRGADRLTIIALWAWTQQVPGSKAKSRCADVLPHLWTGAHPEPIAHHDALAGALGIDIATLPDA